MTMKMLSGASSDTLTNCYAKDHLIPALQELKEEFEFTKQPFSILMLDVDHFKAFNDKHGHLHGDEVLKYFSSSLHLYLVDEANVPFRFGGDEFVVVFPGRDSSYCYERALGLQDNIKSRLFLLKGKQYLMSFSGGVASFPEDAKTAEDLLQKADQALYCSKKNGRGRTTQYNQILFERIKHFIVVAGLLGMIALGGYFYRGDFWILIERLRSTRITIRSVEPVIVHANPVPHPAPKPEEAPAAQPPVSKREFDEVCLKSGDRLVGRIFFETPDEIRINLKMDRGEGMLEIKKADILKIERAGEPKT